MNNDSPTYLSTLKEELLELETLANEMDFRAELEDLVGDLDYNENYEDTSLLANIDNSANKFYSKLKDIMEMIYD
jgi:hypothetical protein